MGTRTPLAIGTIITTALALIALIISIASDHWVDGEVVSLFLSYEFVLLSDQNSSQWRIYIVKFWTHAPPQVQILSISCSFWENLAKSYVGAPLESWRPLLGEILDPPLVADPAAE